MSDSPVPTDEVRSDDFESFFRENYSSLWRYVARRVHRAKVDDVVSASFIVAWEKYSTAASPSLAWLVRIASFEVANSWRKEGRERRLVERAQLEEAVASLHEEFDGSTVLSAMSALSEIDQEILKLVLWEELSREDIAVVLGLSRNAVNVRFHRALQNFEHVMTLPSHIYPVEEDPNAR
jgi:RNA polymerase sigma-70 factor (ECF subfamily)